MDSPTRRDNEIPAHLVDDGHKTDPSELKPSLSPALDIKPSSLPPNSVTFADILATHQAILGEFQSVRLDIKDLKSELVTTQSEFADLKKEVKETRLAFTEFLSKFKSDVDRLHEKPQWVVDFFEESNSLGDRIEKLETAVAIQERLCLRHRGNGSVTPPG